MKSNEEKGTVASHESRQKPTPELDAAPSLTPAPQLPQHPVDRYRLEYWSVLSTSVAKTTATYYANATAAQVWPDNDFYKNAPPFIDSWLCEGWEHGRTLGWLNIIPDSDDRSIYWSEADALMALISDLERGAEISREQARYLESAISHAHAALALARGETK